ncbi:ABC-F type ribosomal protection protein [Psychrobacillus sp. FSL K6-2684]|uniref:ribosomal protection-like ABC-F family protein n=1 Tax=unclassified Psychrobacillus TaxID=2636677 RepID=UPI0011A540C0|nr:ABC-F type ribosomal protection protein [Psychrobacillus sp. AK 1817]QEY21787.1 ABC transporter ATP-binding protein [Psychrobacillus sp. AK 1817]
MTLQGRLTNISITHGDKEIINNIKTDIHLGAVIGIVGRNGEGKSSLLSILSGESSPTSGQIEWIGTTPTISYFKQEDEHFHSNVEEKDERTYISKWSVPNNRPYDALSGGEKMKKRLSKVFAESSQLLLLDEPTNHLDQSSLSFLKEEIATYSGTIILVSHDRYFLDEVSNYIWEIENKNLTVYTGNYSTYRKRKEEKLITHQREYDAQQSKIRQVEKQMEVLKNWSNKAHEESTKKDGAKEYFRMKAKKKDVQIRSKQKRLELELSKYQVERPVEEKEINFSIEGNKKKGKRVIEAKNLSKSFNEEILFQKASFTIQAKERVGILGSNGSGKTTFFRMLTGEETFEGELWKTESMNIGFLRQTVFDLPEDQTPSDFFATTDYDTRGVIQTLMNNLGFSKDHWLRPISTMSMGERVKLKLMEFMVDQKDVLILDEPTNHLDLPSREQLERTLSTYPGTILLVTHDRYFLERLTNKLLIFDKNRIQKLEMNYTDWLSRSEENDNNKLLLALETERQAVLGQLSYLPSKDSKYMELDEQFKMLTQKINQLKNK